MNILECCETVTLFDIPCMILSVTYSISRLERLDNT